MMLKADKGPSSALSRRSEFLTYVSVRCGVTSCSALYMTPSQLSERGEIKQ